MKVLVACEESQTVCKAFRAVGFDAYSCDLQDCSGGKPDWHIVGDAIKEAYSGKYNAMIAHPPCTFMSKAGARWMYANGELNEERLSKAMEAKEFFLKMLNAPIKHIAVENPTPLKVVGLPPHDQHIQPYYFGEPYSKKTLLWLKNLPPLISTCYSDFVPFLPSNTGGKKRGQSYSIGVSKNAKESSKTFKGVAEAMANQWGSIINK
tara:strand:+ start:46 stop:666 length:621 start_codon:yes stop_codon:yes gene_type:complete